MKRLLAVLLCISLLQGCVTVLAEEKGSASAPRANVTDTDAPEIISYRFYEAGETLKPGDTIHVEMKAEDRSEIWNCYAVFVNSARERDLFVSMEYNSVLDTFSGEYTLKKTDLNGEYVLRQYVAADKFGNTMYTWLDNKKAFGKFRLKGADTGAAMKATAKIRENGKTVKPGDTVHVDITLQKKYPGAVYMDILLELEGSDSAAWYGVDYSPSTSKYTITFSFDSTTISGKYLLAGVFLYDENWQGVAEKKLSGQSITLTGGSKDKTPPKFSSASLNEKKKTLTAGDTVHVSLKIKDSSDISYVEGYLNAAGGRDYFDANTKNTLSIYNTNMPWFELNYNSSSKKWEGSYTLPRDLPDGQYFVSIDASDVSGNSTWKDYPKLYINYKSPDYVDYGMEYFISECWYVLWDKEPTEKEIQQYAMPLVTGKQKAVNVIKTLITKSGRTGKSAAYALWMIMQGYEPDETEQAKVVNALKTSLEYAIDSLNNDIFRLRCYEWGIKPGTFHTKASETEVASVDANGGHYVLDGSKATLTGVTDKNITSLVIPDTVSANGKTYKVTKIRAGACSGLAKLASVTIGKNVTSISQEAFSGCKKLKTVTINAAKLKTVGTNAFAGISSKATFKCPKKLLKKYKKLIQKNAPKKAKFK